MFKPLFTITPELAQILMDIEALKQELAHLPMTPKLLAGLQESARLSSARYSTYIEGNRLSQEQIDLVIRHKQNIPGRAREEKEVLGYYAALEELEKLADQNQAISQEAIQYLHALVMGGGKKNCAPTAYRTVQNVIREGITGKIVYLPPEAKDVPGLMHDLVTWLQTTKDEHLPYPLRAAIAHYQFATIHPYLDGNGRTARLLATLVLYKGGYGLNGIYSLEEYYAKDLLAYYTALDLGPSHNYYQGRAEADITPWINYFCAGMRESFEKVKSHAFLAQSKGALDFSKELASLDPRKRKIISLFARKKTISTADIAKLLNIKPRTARALCNALAQQGFLIIANKAKKTRRYGLNPELARSII